MELAVITPILVAAIAAVATITSAIVGAKNNAAMQRHEKLHKDEAELSLAKANTLMAQGELLLETVDALERMKVTNGTLAKRRENAENAQENLRGIYREIVERSIHM
ncbi:MAG: hypothetical protein LBQ80_04120 [Clostridium sp.]|jgi:hypothetical protein|nr:hypothetical protein [Clostridium sp.]